jgi:hypothetical protein
MDATYQVMKRSTHRPVKGFAGFDHTARSRYTQRTALRSALKRTRRLKESDK